MGEDTFILKGVGTVHCIQSLYDQDANEKFKQSELPTWNGINIPGYIVPGRVSKPYWDSVFGDYFIEVSELMVFPNNIPSYDITLPKEGWLVCRYEFAKECGWCQDK